MHEDYSCSLCLWQMVRNLFQYNFDSQKSLWISCPPIASLSFSIFPLSCCVYLPRIFRFPWQRSSDTAPSTSVHPEILRSWDPVTRRSRWGLWEDNTLGCPAYSGGHNRLLDPTPSTELTAKLWANPLNNGRFHIIGGIIDGISSIYYRITVSCFVLMKACFIISIFLMILNTVCRNIDFGIQSRKRVSLNRSRRDVKSEFFAFLEEFYASK